MRTRRPRKLTLEHSEPRRLLAATVAGDANPEVFLSADQSNLALIDIGEIGRDVSFFTASAATARDSDTYWRYDGGASVGGIPDSVFNAEAYIHFQTNANTSLTPKAIEVVNFEALGNAQYALKSEILEQLAARASETQQSNWIGGNGGNSSAIFWDSSGGAFANEVEVDRGNADFQQNALGNWLLASPGGFADLYPTPTLDVSPVAEVPNSVIDVAPQHPTPTVADVVSTVTQVFAPEDISTNSRVRMESTASVQSGGNSVPRTQLPNLSDVRESRISTTTLDLFVPGASALPLPKPAPSPSPVSNELFSPRIRSESFSIPTQPRKRVELTSPKTSGLPPEAERTIAVTEADWGTLSPPQPSTPSPLRALVSLYETLPRPVEQLQAADGTAGIYGEKFSTLPPSQVAPDQNLLGSVMPVEVQVSDPAIVVLSPASEAASGVLESVSDFLDEAVETTSSLLPEYETEVSLQTESIDFVIDAADLGQESRAARIAPVEDDFIDIGAVEESSASTVVDASTQAYVLAFAPQRHEEIPKTDESKGNDRSEVGTYGSTRRFEAVEIPAPGASAMQSSASTSSETPHDSDEAEWFALGGNPSAVSETTTTTVIAAVTELTAGASHSQGEGLRDPMLAGAVTEAFVGLGERALAAGDESEPFDTQHTQLARSTTWGSAVVVLFGATYYQSRRVSDSIDRRRTPTAAGEEAVGRLNRLL